MKDPTAKARGMGNIGGPDLPMATSQNTEGDMKNSMPETTMADLDRGFCAYGSIAADAKSDPAAMEPGEQNRGARINKAAAKDSDDRGEGY